MLHYIIRGFAIGIPLISLIGTIVYALKFNTPYSPFYILGSFVTSLFIFCIIYGFSIIVEYCERKLK